MFRGPRKYSEYVQDVPKSIDWILKQIDVLRKTVYSSGVSRILPGIGISVDPVTGTGDVTISSTGEAVNGLPTGGTTGQILAKIDATNYNAEWIDNYANWTSVVKHEVKAGQALTKGQAVYVSSADGTNMVVSKASNSSEMASSKTMGIIAQNLSVNNKGFVVTEGLLSGLNTSGATAGDPIWLGVNGNILFGIANKPVAPANLVYLGVVTRVNNINGEIFVKVQNGFELDELHNVLITNPQNDEVLAYDSALGLWVNKVGGVVPPGTGELDIDGGTFLAPATGFTVDGGTFI